VLEENTDPNITIELQPNVARLHDDSKIQERPCFRFREELLLYRERPNLCGSALIKVLNLGRQAQGPNITTIGVQTPDSD
jgi:hypothetical protein